MKTIFSIISFSLVVILLASCDATEPIVGSNQDTIIPNLSFIVDTTYLDNSAS